MPTEEENKAIYRRYAEEVGNRHNLEIVDEIFERYGCTARWASHGQRR